MPVSTVIHRHVIGMGVNQRHSAMLHNPIQLFEPDAGVPVAKDEKHRRILRQSIWQFDVARSMVEARGLRGAGWRWVWNPEWKNGANTVWLRLKWIGIERGRFVLKIELVGPLEVVKHE